MTASSPSPSRARRFALAALGLVGAVALAILFLGSLALIQFFLASLTLMADVAATMSLTISPALAWLNHRAMVSDAVPSEARPGTLMRVYSRFGIAVSLMLAVYFVSMRWLVA